MQQASWQRETNMFFSSDTANKQAQTILHVQRLGRRNEIGILGMVGHIYYFKMGLTMADGYRQREENQWNLTHIQSVIERDFTLGKARGEGK